jgi:hypothetical protein
VRPIIALNALLKSPRPIPRSLATARFGAATLRTLDVAGVLLPAASLDSTICRLCDQHHTAELFRSASGHLAYRCVDSGATGAPNPDNIATITANARFVLEALTQAIDHWQSGFPPRELTPGRLWKLGESMIPGGPRWTCFAAFRRFDREVLDLIAADQSPPGLVLSVDPPPTAKVGEHRLIQFVDVIDISANGAVGVDRNAIATALGFRTRARRAAGRSPAGLAAALATVPRLSDRELTLDVLEVIELMRTQGVAFGTWRKNAPPPSLIKALRLAIANEISRRSA